MKWNRYATTFFFFQLLLGCMRYLHASFFGMSFKTLNHFVFSQTSSSHSSHVELTSITRCCIGIAKFAVSFAYNIVLRNGEG